MFVHLTPSANAARIRRSGIRAISHGRTGSRGLYCFPVLPSYTLTHQWLRELARHGGQGPLVAVHIRLPDDEPVTLGRYHRDPATTTAAEAVRRTAALEDPRGWEVFVPRPVTRREVHRLRPVKQVTGWRYIPDAHGRPPAPASAAGYAASTAHNACAGAARTPWTARPPPQRCSCAGSPRRAIPGTPPNSRMRSTGSGCADAAHWTS